ncbi:MAG: T9SS type A sorting domain-containing protein [Bacteroidota bacterium]
MLLVASFQEADGAVITSKKNGKWSQTSTWDTGTIPGAGDDVIILHQVELSKVNSVVTINSVEVSNRGNGTGRNSYLYLYRNVVLNVTGDLTMRGENFDNRAYIRVGINNSQVATAVLNIGGNMSVIRDAANSFDQRLSVELRDVCEINVTGNFVYDYLGSDPTESSLELDVKNSSRLNVMQNFTVNVAGGNQFEAEIEGEGQINVGGNSLFTNTASAELNFLIGDNRFADPCQLNTQGNLTILNGTAGTGSIDFVLDKTAEITTEGMTMIRSELIGKEVTISIIDDGIMRARGLLDLYAEGDGDVLIDMLGGDPELFVRDGFTRSNNFGALASADNASVVYEGMSGAQSIAPDVVAGAGADVFSYQNIEINNTSGVMLDMPGDVTVNGQLILINGIVNPSGNLLTIADGATSNEGTTTSYVDGPVRKLGTGAFVFPLGNAGRWAPLGISDPGPSAEVSAQYFKSQFTDISSLPVDLNNVSPQEYWVVAQLTGTPVTPTLFWKDASASGIDDLMDLTVAGYDITNTIWANLTQAGTTGSVGIGATGSITSGTSIGGPATLTPVTFGSTSLANNTFPVEWLSFDAVYSNGVVNLDWATASEDGNGFFEVERSLDGMVYSSIDRIASTSQNGEGDTYSSIDWNPNQGVSFYRIKQQDLSGLSSYSPVVQVKISNIGVSTLVYPNPSNGEQLFVRVVGNSINDQLQIRMISMEGKEVYQEMVVRGSEVESEFQLTPGTKVPAGVYTLLITDFDSFNEQIRVVIK